MNARRRAAVIGHPVAHSRSPALFAQFAAATGIALAYDAIDVAPADLEATLRRWRADAAFVGCNVTLPHKERALQLADAVEPAARACGAANVLTHESDGTLSAGNTDVAGIESALVRNGVALRGARVAILGAGGAARAVAEAARRNGAARIVVAARDPGRAAVLAREFDGEPAGLDAVPVADLYVNATPVGMEGQEQRSLLPPGAAAGAAAFDLVYTPEQTPFVLDARARGLRTITGTAMFTAQAAATFERWFGVVPPVDALAASKATE
ncbi:MAG TPA: shikimate dehydrogenase [Candidatus Elarobacter sp.]|nr:shikimate dehydrogenase [Candidatus Elarobacter sp.]